MTGDKIGKNGYLLALSLLGIFLVLIATSKYGIGLTPDSISYISAARNLVHQNQLVKYDGSQFLHWPPLYPLMLALFELAGVHAFIGARFLNALLFGGIVYLFGILFIRSSRTAGKISILCAPLSVLLSIPLLQLAINAWSEPLFIFLIIEFFLLFGRFLEEKKRLISFIHLQLRH